MKCINCDTDNNLKERTINVGKCKNCGHQFVFDPKAGSPFSDVAFKKYIEYISGPRNVFFTRKQLIYFLERKLYKIPTWNFYVLIIVFIILYCVAISFSIPIIFSVMALMTLLPEINSQKQAMSHRKIKARFLQFLGGVEILISVMFLLRYVTSTEFPGFVFFLVSVAIGLFMIYRGGRVCQNLGDIKDPFSIELTELDSWLNNWSRVNGQLDKLLPSFNQQHTRSFINPDITSYSFDRLIVCDNAAIAQFLIANNFHFDHNCAIVSITGYPKDIFATILDMVKRNPKLVVYAVHDASIPGVSLAHHLQNTPQWFQNTTASIYDVGLTPQQVLNSKGFFIRNSPTSEAKLQPITPEIRATLSPKEIAWLEAGNLVELESLPPGKLLQILSRQLNLNSAKWSDDSNYNTVNSRISTDIAIFSSSSFG